MTEVDRYDMIVSNAGNYMEIRSDGDWVEVDEYENLTAINAELLAACEQTLEIVRYLDGKAVDILEAAIDNAQP